LDKYSLIGLNQLRGSTGASKLSKPRYQVYLGAFDQQFEWFEPQIAAALDEPWVSSLAEKLGCSAQALSSRALSRKVLDDYLMHTGGYLQNQPKQSTA
jgi:hypothetical protein